MRCRPQRGSGKRIDAQRAEGYLGPHDARVGRRDPFAEPCRAGSRHRADALPPGVPVVGAGWAAGHDVERALAGLVTLDVPTHVAHLVRGQRLLAVGGAPDLDGAVQTRAVPALDPTQDTRVGVGAADPDRDARLLDRTGQAGDLAYVEVAAIECEGLAAPESDKDLQRLVNHFGSDPGPGLLAESGEGHVGTVPLAPPPGEAAAPDADRPNRPPS